MTSNGFFPLSVDEEEPGPRLRVVEASDDAGDRIEAEAPESTLEKFEQLNVFVGLLRTVDPAG